VGKSKKHLRISTQKIIFNLHNSGAEQQKSEQAKENEKQFRTYFMGNGK